MIFKNERENAVEKEEFQVHSSKIIARALNFELDFELSKPPCAGITLIRFYGSDLSR